MSVKKNTGLNEILDNILDKSERQKNILKKLLTQLNEKDQMQKGNNKKTEN